MNEKFDMRFFNKLLKVGGTLLIVALTAFAFNEIGLMDILTKIFVGFIPVVLAISLAYLLEPVIKLLGRLHIKRFFAVIITYSVIGGIIYALFYFLVPGIVSQLQDFFETLPSIIEQIDQLVKPILGNRVDFDLSKMIDEFLSNITTILINNISKITNIIMVIAMAITGSIFLSFDFVKFRQKIKQLLHYKDNNKVYRFTVAFAPTIHRYSVGLIVDNMILFILAAIAFALAKAEYPILFAIIIAITNFIPLIGQFIGGTPIVLIGFANSVEQGVIFLVIIIILQFFESNVMQPIMLRQVLKVRPIENLIGIAIGSALFGLVGMVIAPFLVIAVKIYIQQNTTLFKD